MTQDDHKFFVERLRAHARAAYELLQLAHDNGIREGRVHDDLKDSYESAKTAYDLAVRRLIDTHEMVLSAHSDAVQASLDLRAALEQYHAWLTGGRRREPDKEMGKLSEALRHLGIAHRNLSGAVSNTAGELGHKPLASSIDNP